ncbi:MAG TPA: hypothetical protein VK013_18730 [Myxococcaceae bacterium]|nr:hypothetical protein [Myxococcaceae bacterium]
MRRIILVACLLSCGLAGCDQDAVPPVLDADRSEGLPPNHPEVDELRSLATSRGSGRLSVNQLRLSFPLVAGQTPDGEDISWGNLERYAAALGEPDYADVTIENLDPSPLYAKFMDDASRDVCGRILDNDPQLDAAQDRTLYRFVDVLDTVETNPAGVDQNLRYLKLRFHGVRVPDDDAQGIAPLRTLFARGVEAARGTQSALTEAHVREGWRLVCVALMTAPEFHIY